MAADGVAGQQGLVDDQLYLPLDVKEQLQSGDGARDGVQILLHVPGVGEGQPGAPQLGGQVLGLEGLVPRHHQQIELRLLAVAQKQVFADFAPQDGFDPEAVLHGVRVVVVHPGEGDGQLLQLVVDGLLLGDALVGGTAGVYGGIDVHGGSFFLLVFGCAVGMFCSPLCKAFPSWPAPLIKGRCRV